MASCCATTAPEASFGLSVAAGPTGLAWVMLSSLFTANQPQTGGFFKPRLLSSPLHLARVHLDRRIQHPGRECGLDVEGLFHAEIGLHQLVILLHARAVDPAEPLGRGELVGHEIFDALPLPLLVLLVEPGDLVEQSLEARRDVGDAGCKRLLRDLDEVRNELWIFLEISAVDDQRVA